MNMTELYIFQDCEQVFDFLVVGFGGGSGTLLWSQIWFGRI